MNTHNVTEEKRPCDELKAGTDTAAANGLGYISALRDKFVASARYVIDAVNRPTNGSDEQVKAAAIGMYTIGQQTGLAFNYPPDGGGNRTKNLVYLKSCAESCIAQGQTLDWVVEGTLAHANGTFDNTVRPNLPLANEFSKAEVENPACIGPRQRKARRLIHEDNGTPGKLTVTIRDSGKNEHIYFEACKLIAWKENGEVTGLWRTMTGSTAASQPRPDMDKPTYRKYLLDHFEVWILPQINSLQVIEGSLGGAGAIPPEKSFLGTAETIIKMLT